jgi:TrmH family RNA methyltransferase
VGEAIEAGWEIETLVYAPDQLASDFAQELVKNQVKRKVHCAALTPGLFGAIAEKENPQGILAIVQQRHPSLEDVTQRQFHFGVALVSPQDPGNVGTILRTLDAVGADELFLLDGGVDPYHPSSIRASMGTIFWRAPVQDSFDHFVKWARLNGYHLIGSSAHANTDYRIYHRGSQPFILLLGSEQKGLSEEQTKFCDVTLSIPMKGRASSLNLAVAAGILLYAILGQGI